MSADLLRAAAFVFYFLILGQTAAIIWGYLRARRRAAAQGIKHGGLLPNHVVLLGVSLLGADTEAIWQNYVRIHEPLTGYVVLNPALFMVTNFGLFLVMRYEWRRYTTSKARPRIPYDSLKEG